MNANMERFAALELKLKKAEEEIIKLQALRDYINSTFSVNLCVPLSDAWQRHKYDENAFALVVGKAWELKIKNLLDSCYS